MKSSWCGQREPLPILTWVLWPVVPEYHNGHEGNYTGLTSKRGYQDTGCPQERKKRSGPVAPWTLLHEFRAISGGCRICTVSGNYKIKPQMRELHTPSACWRGSGTRSAAVTPARAYLGVQGQQMAETLQLSSGRSAHGFQSQQEQLQDF